MRKGDPRDCGNSRGVFPVDHAMKGFHSQLKSAIAPYYISTIPADQYGAIANKGSDLATCFIVSALVVARTCEHGVFVLFVDLVKTWMACEQPSLTSGVPSQHRRRCRCSGLDRLLHRRVGAAVPTVEC